MRLRHLVGLCLALVTAPAAAQHPRLLLTPERVQALRDRMSAGDPLLTAVLADADQIAADGEVDYGYQGNDWAGEVPVIGLAFLLTNDMRYATPALAMLDEVNSARASGDISAISVDSTYASRSTGFAVGIAYDWFYSVLGDGRRAETIATVNAYFDHFLTSDRVYGRDGPSMENYFGGHILGYGAMGHATAGDNPRAQEIIDAISGRFESIVRPSFESGPLEGGGAVEGYVYTGNHFIRLFQYMALVGTATGSAPAGAGEWAGEIITTLLHALKPNRWQLTDEGSYTADYTGLLNVGQLFVYARSTSDPAAAAYAAYLIDNHGEPGQGDTGDISPFAELLYGSLDDAPLDYRMYLPTYHHVRGAGYAIARTSWSDDAVWACLNTSILAYDNQQAGHLTLQRGDDFLLVNGHEWKQNKIFENNVLVRYEGEGYQGNTFVSPSSAWTNTLYASDGPGGYLWDDDQYSGGQIAHGEAAPYEIEQATDFTYVKLDATASYSNGNPADTPAVRAFVRNYLFVQPGLIVLYDRVRLMDASIQAELRFHFNSNAPPAVEQPGLASGAVGSSRLYLRSVSPQNVDIAVEWQELDGVDFIPRAVVRAAAPSAELDVLHALYATDIDGGMPESQVIDAGPFTGMFVDVPALARAVLFSTELTGRSSASPIDFTLPDRPLVRVIVADLPAGSTYAIDVASGLAITIREDAAGAFTASAAGLLRFDVRDGVAEPTPDDPPPVDPPVLPRPDGGHSVTDGGTGSGPSGGCGCRATSAQPSATWVMLALFVATRRRL